MRRAYLIERRTIGNPTTEHPAKPSPWILTGSGFYSPAYKNSADACCAKWNEETRDPNVVDASTKYEYRVRTYARA